MRVTWAAAVVLWGGLAACGFYDAVPRTSDPFGPSVPLPNLPDASIAIPDGGEVIIGDGGYRDRDGGIHIPGPDGGFELPDGGMLPDAGSAELPPCPETLCVQETFVSGEDAPMGLGVNSSHVYWVNQRSPSLRHIPKEGGVALTLRDIPTQAPLQVDDAAAYVLYRRSDGQHDSLLRVRTDGASSNLRSYWATTPMSLRSMAQSSTSIYVESPVGLFRSSKAEEVSEEVVLAQGLAGDVREGLAADDDGVYFLDVPTSQLRRIVPSGQLQGLAVLPQGYHVGNLHAADHTLYATLSDEGNWTDCAGVAPIVRIPTSGGAPAPLAASPGCISQLSSDATHLYWLSYSLSRGYFLMRAPRQGGAVWQLARLRNASAGLAVDATHVYWSEPDGGRIQRMAKPQ